LVVGDFAFKFARDTDGAGARCNLYEADLYRRVSPKRQKMLCPIRACAPNGALAIMPTATPLTQPEFNALMSTNGFPDWDYDPRDGLSCPFEYKASDGAG
jgi:hypothetical protein